MAGAHDQGRERDGAGQRRLAAAAQRRDQRPPRPVKWLWGQRSRYESVDLRAVSTGGWQALHAAASGGQLEVVRWLVNRGAQLCGAHARRLGAAARGGPRRPPAGGDVAGRARRQHPARADNGDEPLLLAAAAQQQATVDWLVSAWLNRQQAEGALLEQPGGAAAAATRVDRRGDGRRAKGAARAAHVAGVVGRRRLERAVDGRRRLDAARAPLAASRAAHRAAAPTAAPPPAAAAAAALAAASSSAALLSGGDAPAAAAPPRPADVPKLALPGKEGKESKESKEGGSFLGGALEAVSGFFGGSKTSRRRRRGASSSAGSGALSAEEAAAIRIQCAVRVRHATHVFSVKLMMRRLMVLMANAERRRIKLIQSHYREHLQRKRAQAAAGGGAYALGVPLGPEAAVSPELADAVKLQAARCIQATLDQSLLMNKLRTELRALMEKGRVYKLGSGELVAWGTRFFYVADEGLCYQHVNRRMRPKGAIRVIRWAMITKVEACKDDSVYIETKEGKYYYLRLKGASRPAMGAWLWATHLCQFAQLSATPSTATSPRSRTGCASTSRATCRRRWGAYPPPSAPRPRRRAPPAARARRGRAIPEDEALPDGGAATPRRAAVAAAVARAASQKPLGESPNDSSSDMEEGEETAEERSGGSSGSTTTSTSPANSRRPSRSAGTS